MKQILVPLLLVLALSNALGVEEQSASHSELVDRNLSVEATQLQGEICGNDHVCTNGLECVQVGLFRRCTPQTGCLARELRKFDLDINPEVFKRTILVEANATEDQIAEAAKESLDRVYPNQKSTIRDVIRTLQKHVGAFAEVGSIASRCSSVEQDPESVIIPMARALTPIPTGNPTPILTPESSTASRNEPAVAPSSPPTIDIPQSLFVGFHIEGGALLEGSVTFFFDLNDPTGAPPVYAKGCLGVGAAIGADLSFILIIAETTEPSEITCLSTMYSVDIGVGLNLGYGLGVCMLAEPSFVYQEFTFGAGAGVGASTFSMCSGAETGIDLGLFGGGR
jgi:hypothetical protein